MSVHNSDASDPRVTRRSFLLRTSLQSFDIRIEIGNRPLCIAAQSTDTSILGNNVRRGEEGQAGIRITEQKRTDTNKTKQLDSSARILNTVCMCVCSMRNLIKHGKECNKTKERK